MSRAQPPTNAVRHRRLRWPSWLVATAVVVTACTGDRSDDGVGPAVVGTLPGSERTVADVVDDDDIVDDDASSAPLRVVMGVTVDDTGANDGLQVDLEAEVDPAALDGVDPFGDFASCSGARRSFGPYTVLVSSVEGPIASASVITATSVSAPGIYDADVRVERRSGGVAAATGTLTLDPGLRSGSFLAFPVDGGALRGTFECEGGDPSSAPLTVSSDGGRLAAVEMVALLRRGDAERIVGLAVDPEVLPSVTAECPAAVGGSGLLLVLVDGDQSVGAATTFELTGGDAPTLRLRVGGASYEFDQVTIELDDPGTAGTFSAAAGGVSVDGAFRCR